jgi:hypothetical protein
MHVYLDESGDTGWKFSLPFRAGGSSRFLCLSFLFLPKIHKKKTKQIISSLYRKYGWTEEKKASLATENQKLDFCAITNQLLVREPTIKIDCIVAKKENVQPHIRTDSNKLYNYMCKLVMIDYVRHVPEFIFVPDKRSIKVESGNSLADYLQTVLWFECGASTVIMNCPQESHKNYNLQFVDWVSSCVWSHFEDGESTVYREISRHVRVRQLFFDPPGRS